jgi:hypothetical protein
VQEEQLNFESSTGVVEHISETQPVELIPEGVASGISFGLTLLSALMVLIIYFKLRSSVLGETSKNLKSVRYEWHLLSCMVSGFLLLNIGFGGMTAFLLGRTNEDARAYFSEISAFKLAKLSHEHFFGYGISFGVIAALSFFFISNSKSRVILPSLFMFVFGGLDVASWWLARFVSFGFHNLSYVTGAVFALSFVSLYLQLNFVHIKILLTCLGRK